MNSTDLTYARDKTLAQEWILKVFSKNFAKIPKSWGFWAHRGPNITLKIH